MDGIIKDINFLVNAVEVLRTQYTCCHISKMMT